MSSPFPFEGEITGALAFTKFFDNAYDRVILEAQLTLIPGVENAFDRTIVPKRG